MPEENQGKDAASGQPAQGGAPPASDVDTPGNPADPRVQELEAQLAQMRDRWARARADYENLQRRVERDAAIERDRAKARVLEGLLGVHELAQLAAAQAAQEPGPLAEGIQMVAKEFSRLLEREGLTPTGMVGEPFDARRHEAVAQEGGAADAPGTVTRVIQPGYRLGDKVLRFAKVAVAPGQPATGGKEPQPAQPQGEGGETPKQGS